jgi:hypothetical protein
MTRTRFAALAAGFILFAAAAIELVMGRVPICTCGTVDLWVNARDSFKTSQMIADWYTFSHIVHGFLFYCALWLMFRRWPVEWRFIAALLVESAWEVFENTPFVVNHYRAVTITRGYNGDSVLNSVADILWMCGGFLVARKLPVWASVVLVLVLELVPLIVIRDNLALNVWMFLAPSKAIVEWQAGG